MPKEPKITALYERLSRDDDLAGESNSIGEIEDEHLLSALEKLSDEDLELLTLYIYEGYSTVELSKAYGIAHQNISKRIIKITNFLKNF